MKKHILPVLLACLMLLSCCGCSVFSDLGDQVMGTSATAEPIVISDYFDPVAAEAEAAAEAKAARQELSADEAASQLALSVVKVTAFNKSGKEIASGTGFFTTGGVVTALSTVRGAASATITLADTGVYEVTGVHYYDQNMNLVVLACAKQQAPDLTASEWETDDGSVVFVLGADGSAVSGSQISTGEIAGGYDCVSVTADINEENNGGPVVNAYGELLGVALYNPLGDDANHVISAAALGCIDLTQTYSLEEMNDAVGDVVSGDGTQVITGDDGEKVYSKADAIETEPNDDTDSATELSEDAWTAGYVNLSGRSGELEAEDGVELSEASLIADSTDIYCFTVDEACTVEIYLKPYYSNDIDSLDGTWMVLEDGADSLSHLKNSDGSDTGYFNSYEEDGSQYQHAKCEVEAGTYYVKVVLLDGWDYDAGCYYTISYNIAD